MDLNNKEVPKQKETAMRGGPERLKISRAHHNLNYKKPFFSLLLQNYIYRGITE